MNKSSGRLLANAPDLATFLSLEAKMVPAHIQASFKEIAALTGEFLILSLDEVKGYYRTPLEWSYANNKDLWGFNPAQIVVKLSAPNLQRLNCHFSGEIQIKHGAVWLDAPTDLSIPRPTYQRLTARPLDDPGLLFYLSVATPLLTNLLRFMDIRQGSPLLRTKEFQLEGRGKNGELRYNSRQSNAAWFKRTSTMYDELGIKAEPFFSKVKSVSHFFRLPAKTRHGIIEEFLDQICIDLTDTEVVERLRVERIQAAIQAYYRLSGKNNRPVPRRRFLKKAHQWLLSGYFEGS